jgi:Na+-translocating ferredoxin:NAD+ oxidoreductase RnfD subunit
MIGNRLQAQLRGAVRRGWISIVRVGAAAALGAFALGELGGILFNGGHLTFFVHLVSFALALIAGYGAALTMGIFQAVRGVFSAIADVEADIDAMTHGGPRVVDAPPRS